TSSPQKRIDPDSSAISTLGSRRVSARPKVLLPEPDSPTMPTHWPGWTSISTPSTAFTVRPCTRRGTLTSPALSSGAFMSGFQLRRNGRSARVEHFGDAVSEQIEAEHGDTDRHAGKDAHPPRRVEEFLAAVQHLAPARHGWIGQAKEAQTGLDQDRRTGIEGD